MKFVNLPIKKQTVLITGAGRGLGSEIAKSFHREGAKVLLIIETHLRALKNYRIHWEKM